MSPHQFLLALRARARIFALLLLATIVSVAVVSLLLPKKYVAAVSLLVDRKDDPNAASARHQGGYMQTQVDILTSRRVAGQVVRDLKLAQLPAMREAFAEEADFPGTIEEWLTEKLLERVKVDASQSSVLQVTFSATDPRFAADVANAFAAAYADVTLRVEPMREAAVWFEEQLKDLRKLLEQKQAKVAAYHQEKGLIASDERVDVESARLSELSTQLVQAQSASFDSATRRRQAADLLGKGISPETLPEILAQPFLQQIKVELMRSETQLSELASRLGPNHPQYQSARTQHAALRAKLDGEMRKVIGGLENGDRQSHAREEELAKALAAQRAKVMRLKEWRSELAVLTRELESAQKAYDTALQRAVVTNVDSRARQANVSLLTEATPPLKAARPKLGLNIALSVVIGILLGLTAVYFLEIADRRVRSRGDLEVELNAPLLVVLDDLRSKAPPRLLGPGIRPMPALLPRLE